MKGKKEEKLAISWSGGKDCTVALYRSLSRGLNVSHLLTVMRSDGRSAQHRIPQAVLEAQASSLGLSLASARLKFPSPRGFQLGVLEALQRLKEKEGITGCIFGDINVKWRRWTNEAICERAGIKAFHPLWGCKEEEVVEEFINRGFKAIIVAVNTRVMSDEWLGEPLNRETVNRLRAAGIDPTGEGGEFHTLVTGGPLFKGELLLTRKVVTPSLVAKHLDLRYLRIASA